MSTFHGMPVQEAKATVYLRATKADGGVKGDPLRCRWANAAHRMYGGLAAFFRTVAYIEIEPGKIVRFEPKVEQRGKFVSAGKKSFYRKSLADFDVVGDMPEATLVFGPVKPGRTLKARSAENKARIDIRPSRPKNVLNTGTRNGKQPVAAARGNYNPAKHK